MGPGVGALEGGGHTAETGVAEGGEGREERGGEGGREQVDREAERGAVGDEVAEVGAGGWITACQQDAGGAEGGGLGEEGAALGGGEVVRRWREVGA